MLTKFFNRKAKLIYKIVANVTVILFGISLTAGYILSSNQSAINSFFGIQTSYSENGVPINEGSLKFTTNFKSVNEVKTNAENFTQEIVREGVVLLKNDNNALPLAEDHRNVSVFSISCVNYVAGGTGSSGTNKDKPKGMKSALESRGFTVNADLWSWYKDAAAEGTYGRKGTSVEGGGSVFSIGEAPWSALPSAKSNSADAAIFLLSRNGGEGGDVYINNGDPKDMTDGNYLKLSPQEKDVLLNLKTLKDQGTVKKIIVLMNSVNQVECDFLFDEAFGVDAALWIGDIGSTGIYAVADILAGETNPSGRLPDTFWNKHYYNPVMANFGDHIYQKAETMKSSLASRDFGDHYVVYQEGIYLGYRYTETRYEDVVTQRPNAGSFDYNKVVAYPFGYGLSYTTFAYSDIEITAPEKAGDAYTAKVTVTNTGSVPGKEVVQVYLQKPYTDYDIENKVEKAAVELVGFAKTNVLGSGESQELTIPVDSSLFASYDAYGAGTYILDEGKYYLTVAANAHAAVNNILAAKGYDTTNGMTENGDAAAVKDFDLAFDSETYSVSVTGQKIENRFTNADINLYDGTDNQVTYISRNDWEGTTKLGLTETSQDTNNHVVLTATAQIVQDIKKPVPEKDDTPYPTYGSTETAYTLADMYADENGQSIPYDSPRWESLLDQLTWDETLALLSHGQRLTYAVESIAKPQTIDHNGANGPVQPYGDNKSNNRGFAVATDDPDKNSYPTLYPCNALVAATFNTELVEEFGVAMGEDCLWAGYNGIYGFGINIHRSAYGGRDYEYYSEDGVLSGMISSAEVKGIQSKGTYVYMKHCLLNDQETYREGICTWANEQSIREIYLKPFEISIVEGGAYNVMSSFNRIGVKWSGHQGFLQTVIKDEFGMRGFAVTDYYLGMMGGAQTYMSLPAGLLNGSDLPDGDSPEELVPYKTGYGNVAWAMREAAHRILYTVAQSNVQNSITTDSRVVTVTPAWVIAMTAVEIFLGVASAVSLAAYCLSYVLARKQGGKNIPDGIHSVK